MARYNGNYEVDLTTYDWTFGDDCGGMISVYPNIDMEDIFTEEPLLKEDDVYRYLNLYYTEKDDKIQFESLKLELDRIESDIICTEKEIRMFNDLLKTL